MVREEVAISLRELAGAARQDSFYLFLGAAFVTVALLALGALVVRRRRDPLLAYFSLFAGLYGVRLIMQRSLVGALFSESETFPRVREAINYLVPVPALFFFQAAGFGRYLTRYMVWGFAILGSTLFALTLTLGSYAAFTVINNVAVLGLLLLLFADVAKPTPTGQGQEVGVARAGLLVFAGLAVYDNVIGLSFRGWPKVEPIGFAVFLTALGYVTARRIFQRESRLIAIEKELDIARRIQSSILPAAFPPRTTFRVAARYVPMTSVAGDFYDFVVADADCTGLLVADVSGHGVPAALIASMVKLAAASQKSNAHNPAEFLSGMNAALLGNTQAQFITASYAYLDAVARRLSYAAAGHPPMLLLRKGEVIEVEENGLMLAVFDFATYSDRALDLKPADRILLYTDGVLEASNASGEAFGRERLGQSVRNSSRLGPDEAADSIVREVKAWSATQEDDITIMLCDFVDRG
jgi:sigma-B regulation protein RsbU (phosphoserine phosphatase)